MFDNDVVLREEDHRYFHNNGTEYLSNSRLVDQFKRPFNREVTAFYSARKRLKSRGIDPTEEQIEIEKQVVLSEWAAKLKNAQLTGIHVHKVIETYFKTTKIIDSKYEEMVRAISRSLVEYPLIFSEQVLHYDKYLTAGKADKICFRAKSKKGIVDIPDYKTNVEKGIEYSNKYGEYFLPPIDHLEACNYNEYALKMSLYGLYVEEQYGYCVGKLSLTFIPVNNPMAFKYIPIPFMKMEAQAILKAYNETKKKNELYEPSDF